MVFVSNLIGSGRSGPLHLEVSFLPAENHHKESEPNRYLGAQRNLIKGTEGSLYDKLIDSLMNVKMKQKGNSGFYVGHSQVGNQMGIHRVVMTKKSSTKDGGGDSQVDYQKISLEIGKQNPGETSDATEKPLKEKEDSKESQEVSVDLETKDKTKEKVSMERLFRMEKSPSNKKPLKTKKQPRQKSQPIQKKNIREKSLQTLRLKRRLRRKLLKIPNSEWENQEVINYQRKQRNPFKK